MEQTLSNTLAKCDEVCDNYFGITAVPVHHIEVKTEQSR